LTDEQRAERIARRKPENVRRQKRLGMARLRRDGTPEQKQKIAARNAARFAIYCGKLVREVCEVPSCEEVGQAHHDDYSRPLDVRWLCRVHHEALHKGF
jgi:hypothetical protein